MNTLEGIKNRVGMIDLGANRIVGTEAILGDMGWSSFEERIFKGTLTFKIRLEIMGEIEGLIGNI